MKGAGASFQLVQTCRQTGPPRRWVQTPKQRPQLCNLHTGAALTLCCPAENNVHVKNKPLKTDVLPVRLQADGNTSPHVGLFAYSEVPERSIGLHVEQKLQAL